MSKNSQSYFDRLVFDSRLLYGPIAAWVSNVRLVILLVIAILFLGTISFLNIPRRLNPEIKIPIVTVVTVLPGASPEDIESLVTIPLETDINSIGGIDNMTSVSEQNTSVISLQFLSSVPRDKAKQDVQTVVDSITDIPEDALTPKVRIFDFEDQPIWTFTVETDEDPASLMRFAQQLKSSLENIAKIDRVVMSGIEEQQISVLINPEKVSQYGINPLTVSGLIRAGLASYPAGVVQTGNNTFSLSLDPTITSVSDIRNIRVNTGSQVIRLSDIAVVAERTPSQTVNSYIAAVGTEPKRTVTVSVYKTLTANIDAAEKNVRIEVEKILPQFGHRFSIRTLSNSAQEIKDQYAELLGEFRSTIILVMICLFVFLGLRQALISSLTVPLTFLSAFVLMQYLGMSLNFLTLFAFLIALGLLIDDTIVTVQAMTSYYLTGKFTPFQTGVIVWRDLIVPIWSTTATTIWSFVPLLLASGIIGEFIKPIPVVVTVTMISSTAIAVLITLPFMVVLLKPNIPSRVKMLLKISGVLLSVSILLYVLWANALLPLVTFVYLIVLGVFLIVRKPLLTALTKRVPDWPVVKVTRRFIIRSFDRGLIDLDILGHKYYRLIERIIASKGARKKVIAGIIIYAVWAFALLPLGFVKNEFFPKSDSELIYLTLELPGGTNKEILTRETLTVLDDIRLTPESEYTVANVGQGLSGFGSTQNNLTASLITIKLRPESDRRTPSYVIAETVRNNYKNYRRGKITVTEISGGPPAGADLQVSILGDDLDEINGYADKIMSYLKSQTGVINVEKSLKSGTSKIVFSPDAEMLARYGLTNESVGFWLRTFASGFPLGEVSFDRDSRTKKDVVFSFDTGIPGPDDITRIQIPSQSGPVPLTALGNLEAKSNPTSITRQNGKRTVSVSAGVTTGYNVTQKNQELTKFADSLQLPDGYSWETGGVNEENQKSVVSILQAMALAFILILVTMVVQFKSYRQAAIVLMVIPLAVSSVFVAFALTGTPLSFPALIGVLALFGIVVTNSMFIVDKINLNLKLGLGFREAIADAGATRLEPIILTKLCTVLGLLPITLASPLWRGLGGAIISGILIASTIMLLFIPVLYYEWYKNEYEIRPASPF